MSIWTAKEWQFLSINRIAPTPTRTPCSASCPSLKSMPPFNLATWWWNQRTSWVNFWRTARKASTTLPGSTSAGRLSAGYCRPNLNRRQCHVSRKNISTKILKISYVFYKVPIFSCLQWKFFFAQVKPPSEKLKFDCFNKCFFCTSETAVWKTQVWLPILMDLRFSP